MCFEHMHWILYTAVGSTITTILAGKKLICRYLAHDDYMLLQHSAYFQSYLAYGSGSIRPLCLGTIYQCVVIELRCRSESAAASLFLQAPTGGFSRRGHPPGAPHLFRVEITLVLLYYVSLPWTIRCKYWIGRGLLRRAGGLVWYFPPR